MAGVAGRFSHRTIALVVVGLAMAAAAVLIAAWGGAFVSGDPLGYAVRLATQPLDHAMLHPPANKYLIAFPLLIYQGMFDVFGLGSDVPYRALGIALIILCAGLLFLLLRQRVGDLFAVLPTVLVLLFGPGWWVVLTPDRLPSQIALAAGLGMMLALERADRPGDIAAAILLAVSLASHPVGVAFAAVATVMILLRLPPDRLRSLWVVVVPGALFAAWWLFIRSPNTQSEAPGLGDVLGFVGDSWAALTAATSGLFGVLDAPAFDEPAGWVAAALLLALVAWGVARYWWRLPPTFWAAAAGLIVLMAATRLSPAGFTRVPDEPRYLYPEVFLLLIALASLAAAVRPPRWVLWVASGILALSLWASVDLLHDEGATVRTAADRVRARLGAVEIAGENAQPAYKTTPFMPTSADYAAAADAYGGIGFTPEELASQPAPIRLEADRALVGALGLELEPATPTPPDGGRSPQLSLGSRSRSPDDPPGCLTVEGPHAEVVLRSTGAWIGSDDLKDAGLNLGRFADQALTPLAPVKGGQSATLSIPADDVEEPWRLGIDSPGPVTVCGVHEPRQRPSGLPPGWERASASPTSIPAGILDCLGIPITEATTSGLHYTGPRSADLYADLIVWPTSKPPLEALRALSRTDATECVRLPFEKAVEPTADTSARVTRARPPSTAGTAVAFRQTIETDGRKDESVNTIFVSPGRRKAGVLIGAVVSRPISSGVLSRLIVDADAQMTAKSEP